ncbi:hypothetical protein BC936DRAFT_142146 [Jimgerdemannia flammicorona]|uniref:Uncharacterized protein n=1 Tax=Jimgerdemannia flammicorona TaxID=994334 RepID=A0A433A0Z8_9FUNG|nr:hypothetical protein BC936DRAFT_142146 [Jimgerdemannia flammicorona]
MTAKFHRHNKNKIKKIIPDPIRIIPLPEPRDDNHPPRGLPHPHTNSLPTRNLSYTSLIGIISAANLFVVVMHNRLSKDVSPGSLRDSMIGF